MKATQPAAARAEQQRAPPARSSAQRLAAPPTVSAQRAGCACGGGCPRCAQKHPITAPGDAVEQEAERTAARVVQGAGPPLGAGPPPPAKPDASVDTSNGGRPLDPGARAFMERRFGRSLRGVSIHDDAQSAQEAEQLGARAFTLGSNVFFGAGEYRPDGRAGQELLAHELTHVLQQTEAPAQPSGSAPGPTTASPLAIARQPQPQTTTAPPPIVPARSPDFRDLWPSFRLDMHDPVTPALRDRARAVLNTMGPTATRVEKQTVGIELAMWFMSNGMAPEAERALDDAESAWVMGSVEVTTDVPPAGVGMADGPVSLINAAQTAARADRHDDAFRLFGLAYRFLIMQVQQETERRGTALATPAQAAIASTTRAMFIYPTVSQIYDRIRDILGFYLQLERDATAAGQTQRAAQMAARATSLRQHLHDRYAWSGEAMITEVTRVQTPVGPGIRLHGNNAVETDVTPFEGLPTPEEIGANNYQWQSSEGVTDSLWRQVQFLGELQRHPDIVREFAGEAIDMNSEAQRLRVWRALARVFLQQGSRPDALDQLMATIGRYLKAFTMHTQYNIRDWGENYLTSDMPIDLAGRAARDCGVYALTVAHEVFRTARGATPRRNLDFEITVVPGHVALVIYDRDDNGFYIVNNDDISARQTGGRPEAEAALAPSMAGTFGRRNFVTPSIRMDLGDTSLSNNAFRTQAWSRYREASGWSISPRAREPSDTRPEAERREAHTNFYRQQEDFDNGTMRLGGVLNRLSGELAPMTDAQQLTRLQTESARLGPIARSLGDMFITLGPAAFIGVDPSRPRLIQRLTPLKRYLFSWQPVGSAHPIARVAMSLLRLQQLGGTLTTADQALITWCDSIAMLHSSLQTYRAAGFPAAF